MFLLQLLPGSSVALQGDYWQSLSKDFESAGLRTVRLGELPPRGQLTAAFLETSALPGNHRSLLQTMPPNGRVVILSRQHLIPASWQRRRIRRIARASGYAVDAEFRPFPTVELVEVFLSSKTDPSEWQLRQHIGPGRITRILKPHGKHRLWMLDRSPGGTSGLAQAVLLASIATGDTGLSVERFHLRRRGALVFVMARGDLRHLLRVATNESVARLTRQNHAVLNALRARTLPDSLRTLLPAPLGEARLAPVEAFAEEYKPGRLAWTLYRDSRCRDRIDRDLFHFSHQLQLSTRREISFSAALLDGFVERHLGAIQHRLGNEQHVSAQLHHIANCLRRLLSNRVMSVCTGHGDFGVGNALATSNGAVTAIIDWDQYEEMDLPGTDWCDYVLKANHYRYSVPEAFARLVGKARQTGWLAPAHQGFGTSDFGLTVADLRLIPCLALLREMNRAARFPGELQQDVGYYRSQLEMVGECLSGEGA